MVPAEVLVHSLIGAACLYRVDAGSAPLEVPVLMALVSTEPVSRGSSSAGDDGSSQGVLVAMSFELVAHSTA